MEDTDNSDKNDIETVIVLPPVELKKTRKVTDARKAQLEKARISKAKLKMKKEIEKEMSEEIQFVPKVSNSFEFSPIKVILLSLSIGLSGYAIKNMMNDKRIVKEAEIIQLDPNEVIQTVKEDIPEIKVEIIKEESKNETMNATEIATYIWGKDNVTNNSVSFF